MRLNYVSDASAFESKEDRAIVERIKQRRGGSMLALDKALLISPPIADGWNSFFGAIRTRTTISASIRETAICRIAVLNHAQYEWDQHIPILKDSGGVDTKGIEYLQTRPGQGAERQEAEDVLGTKLALVVEYTDAMTLCCLVSDSLFDQMKQHFNEREIMEITSTIAAYNCVSRFLVALDVGEMAAKHGTDIPSASSEQACGQEL